MTYPTALAAKVAAQNEANGLANTLYRMAIEALRPFFNQKILKADGNLLEKVRKALPVLPHNNDVRAFYVASRYSLRINVDINKLSNKSFGNCQLANYMESRAYLCDLDSGGVITKFYRFPDNRIDYTEEEILAARGDLKAAQNALSLAQSRLGSFGEYDA